MPDQTFSARLGHAQPKAITYRDELPEKFRLPIFAMLRRYTNPDFLWERIEKLFNPYGTDEWPESTGAISVAKEEDHPRTIAAKRVLLRCPWFRVYDVIEDIYDQLCFYDSELRSDPDEEPRSGSFHQEINDYFTHVGIGWKLDDNGKIATRGDEAFEGTVKVAIDALEEAAKPTAAGHLRFAIAALSVRPNANTSGAVVHATNAVECVLGELTGKSMTLGKYLDRYPDLFHKSLKKGLDGIYGYASDEGARHGKEGTQPSEEEAEFAVATCAAVCTLLIRKRPK